MPLDKDKLEEMEDKIKKLAAQQGLDLVDFKVIKHRQGSTLRALVDYTTGGVTMDECSRLNRMIFSLIERESILGEDFSVEVNSPGLDRPIKKGVDFRRVKGSEVMIWLNEPVGQKTYIEAVVLDVDDNMLLLEAGDSSFQIPLDIVKVAKQKIKTSG